MLLSEFAEGPRVTTTSKDGLPRSLRYPDKQWPMGSKLKPITLPRVTVPIKRSRTPSSVWT